MQKSKLSLNLFYSAVIALVTMAAFSCKKSSTPPQTTEQKLTGKWTMVNAIGNYTVQGNNSKDTTKYTSADYFNFKADGTITIVATGTTYNGNWKVANSKLYITNTNYIDYANGFDLPVLTSTDLQLYYLETTSTYTTEQKLNLKK